MSLKFGYQLETACVFAASSFRVPTICQFILQTASAAYASFYLMSSKLLKTNGYYLILYTFDSSQIYIHRDFLWTQDILKAWFPFLFLLWNKKARDVG